MQAHHISSTMCIASGCNGLLLYGQNGAQRQLFPETNMSSTKIDQIIRTTHTLKNRNVLEIESRNRSYNFSSFFFPFQCWDIFLRDLDGSSGHFKSYSVTIFLRAYTSSKLITRGKIRIRFWRENTTKLDLL